MNLHSKLQQRAAQGRLVRIGLIGAGKFGSMCQAQVPRTPGMHLVAIDTGITARWLRREMEAMFAPPPATAILPAA